MTHNQPFWNLLLLDDDEDDYTLTQGWLDEARPGHFKLTWIADYETALACIRSAKFDAILVDYDLGGLTGLDFMRAALADGISGPFILITGRGGYDVDLEAMQTGAAEYLSKFDLTGILLERTIRYAIERRRNREELLQAYKEVERTVEIRTEALRREIEERKRVQQTLEDYRERMQLVLNNLPITLWTINRDGVFTAYQGTNQGDGEVVGRSVFERFGDRPEHADLIRRALAGETFIAQVTFPVGPRGSETDSDTRATIPSFDAANHALPPLPDNRRTYETHFHPIFGDDGRVNGITGLSIDITERLTSQQRLAETEARYRAIFDLSSNGITLLDAGGRYLDANLAFEQMTGYNLAELRGVHFTRLTHPEDVDAELERLQTLLSGETETYQTQKRCLHKNGTVIPLLLTRTLLRDAHGAVKFIFGIYQPDDRQLPTAAAIYPSHASHSSTAGRLPLKIEMLPQPVQPESVAGAIRLYIAPLARSHAETVFDLDLQADGESLTKRERRGLLHIAQEAVMNAVLHAQASRISVRLLERGDFTLLEVEDDGRGFTPPTPLTALARRGFTGLIGASEQAHTLGGALEIISAPGRGTLVRASLPIKTT